MKYTHLCFEQVQRHLQLRIEAQAKYLQAVLDKAQDTVTKQNLGEVGLEATKARLSESVSRVSNKCLNSTKHIPSFCHRQNQLNLDGSLDSCLTYCGGSQRNQDTLNNVMNSTNLVFAPINRSKNENDTRNKTFDVELQAINLSMSIQRGKWNDDNSYNQETNHGASFHDRSNIMCVNTLSQPWFSHFWKINVLRARKEEVSSLNNTYISSQTSTWVYYRF